jgi:glycosyltransferase involved in cell wall biosynthesis
MNGAGPLVSIVIPAFNAARYIRQALESVFRQTYPSIEIVVVDDGSEDDTRDAVLPFLDRLTYTKQAHLGIGAARNNGVGLARGSLLSFLDADDLFEPEKTQVQVRHLRERPDVDLVFGHVEEFLSEELPEAERQRLLLRPGAQPGLFAQSMLIRREAFDRVGPFREGLRAAEFVDWYSRARVAGLRHAVLPDLVFRRRLHLDNTSRREGRDPGDFLRVVKTAMDRRRDRNA